ncbi:MAG TPA: hypothetical protein VJ938_05495 [Acidimicrobiia bacterium]|nr:hypothetical protein [Acidimicrobiia bacterium]
METVVGGELMRNNKRFQQIVIWIVVVGMLLTMVASVAAVLAG